MKKVLTLLMIIGLTMFIGCAGLQNQPTVCEKPEAANSVICKISTELGFTVEQADWMLQLSSAVLLERNPDEAKIALAYIDGALKYLKSQGITYELMAKYLKLNMPLTFQVATNGILDQMLDIKDMIDPFDLYLIETHLEHQKALVESAMGGN